MKFADRDEAARQLALALKHHEKSGAIVLAIPRGGVPVGAIVARELQLPFDIILAKKIGHPSNSEYAIGAVTLHGIHYDRHAEDVDQMYIRNETKRLQRELLRRQELFTGGKAPAEVKGKDVILVDDGIATGSTLIAAIMGLRKSGVANIIVAVPVAPVQAGATFRKLADEYICLHESDSFSGVGQFYDDFSEVSDSEVTELLRKSTFTV